MEETVEEEGVACFKDLKAFWIGKGSLIWKKQRGKEVDLCVDRSDDWNISEGM